jgi:hypothetical protein
MKTKNPGLGARQGTVAAALAARGQSSPEPEAGEIVALSVRLPKATHDTLRRIVFEEGNRGSKISIHSLILDGIAREMKARGE